MAFNFIRFGLAFVGFVASFVMCLSTPEEKNIQVTESLELCPFLNQTLHELPILLALAEIG